MADNPEERMKRNQRIIAEFPFAVTGWAPEGIRGMAADRCDKNITLEEAQLILIENEQLLKGTLWAAGRDYLWALLEQKYPKQH